MRKPMGFDLLHLSSLWGQVEITSEQVGLKPRVWVRASPA